MRTLLALLSMLFFASLVVAFDYVLFEEEVYDYVCDGAATFDVRVYYFGPHIVSTWIWVEYPDALEIDWQNIQPGSGWHTESNGEYSVTIEFIGPGPGAWFDNRLIVWMHDWDYGCDGDKPIFIVNDIVGWECYEGEFAVMVEERVNQWGAPLHDIIGFGNLRGFEPSVVEETSWGTIKAMYRN